MCLFFDAHLWCQVSRTLLWYFQRYRLFSIYRWSNLHNRKMSISLKRKKIFQKEKRHSSVFWKAFQMSGKYFSCHRHFKYLDYSLSISMRDSWLGLYSSQIWLYKFPANNLILKEKHNFKPISPRICFEF